MEDMRIYLTWLEAGREPAAIKADLMRLGHSAQDAHDRMVYIDGLYLSNKMGRKEVRDGSVYKIAGWVLVLASLVISIGTFWYASIYGGWIVLLGGGGGGFSLIRYGLYQESPDIISRARGFTRKFQRNSRK
jgi:hypothetical protein